MDNVAKALGKHNNVRESSPLIVDNSRPIGIEIELEKGRYILEYPLHYWITSGDGSLKDNGIELKFNEPLSGQDILFALKEYEQLLRKLKERDTFPVLSDRCSIHIHVSISDFSLNQLDNLIDNFIIMEQLFYKIGNPIYKRNLNNNCLSLTKQNEIIRADNIRQYFTNPKYSSLYLNKRFGTAEIRVFNASFSFTQILQWVNVLLEFFKFSKKDNLLNYNTSVNINKVFPIMNHYVQSFLPIKYNYSYMSHRLAVINELHKFMDRQEYIYEEQDAHPLTTILIERGLL